jgi:predicted secreted protein
MEAHPNEPVDRLDGMSNEERLRLMDTNLPTSGFSWNLSEEQKQVRGSSSFASKRSPLS